MEIASAYVFTVNGDIVVEADLLAQIAKKS